MTSVDGRFVGIPAHFLSEKTWRSLADAFFSLVYSRSTCARVSLHVFFPPLLSNHLPPALHGGPSDFGG